MELWQPKFLVGNIYIYIFFRLHTIPIFFLVDLVSNLWRKYKYKVLLLYASVFFQCCYVSPVLKRKRKPQKLVGPLHHPYQLIKRVPSFHQIIICPLHHQNLMNWQNMIFYLFMAIDQIILLNQSCSFVSFRIWMNLKMLSFSFSFSPAQTV